MLEGWAYRIPQFKADLFLRRMDDLLAEPPPLPEPVPEDTGTDVEPPADEPPKDEPPADEPPAEEECPADKREAGLC